MSRRMTARSTMVGLSVLAVCIVVLLAVQVLGRASRPPEAPLSPARSAAHAAQRAGDKGVAEDGAQPVRENLGREGWARATQAEGPSTVDEVLLLVTFGWSVQDALERLTANSPFARGELLEALLEIEPDGENTGSAQSVIDSIKGLGLVDDEAAERLFTWADRSGARLLARDVGRLLIAQGARGRELAAELARSHWNRAIADPDDIVSALCASYVVHELGAARAAEAVPVLHSMAAQAIERAMGQALQLQGVEDRVKELGADPKSAAAKWQADPRSEKLDAMVASREYAAMIFSALVAIDTEEVALWAEEILTAEDSGALDLKAQALVASLRKHLPERPDGALAARLKPWVLKRLGPDGAVRSGELPMLHRVAGIYGSEAVPALVRAVAAQGSIDAVSGLAQAVAMSGDADGLAALRTFAGGERKITGSPEDLPAARRAVLETVMAKGDVEDRSRLADLVLRSPPAEAAVLLSVLPDSMWEGRPQDLVDVLAAMEGLLEKEPEASEVVRLALKRLIATGVDPRVHLAGHEGSTSERLASMCSAAIWYWEFEHASSAEQRLEFLRQAFRDSVNPFRRLGAGRSLWEVAIAFARDPETAIGAIAAEFARAEAPIGLRVALCRGLALRDPGTASVVLELAVPGLAEACRQAFRPGADWSRQYELGHWKSIAWIAVSGVQGRAIAARAIERLLANGRAGIQPKLAERLPVLEQYLAAFERCGWDALDTRLEGLVSPWNLGEDLDRLLVDVAELCAQAPARYLEARAVTHGLPLAIRIEMLLALSRAPAEARVPVRALAASVLADGWRRIGDEAVAQDVARVLQRGPEGRRLLENALADLGTSADPVDRAFLAVLARELAAGAGAEAAVPTPR